MASLIAPDATYLNADQVNGFLSKEVPAGHFQGKRVLLIVPDSTRTAPVGMVFKSLFATHGKIGRAHV